MGNCLKTQLKESVQNNTLPKVGEIIFNVTPSAQDIADGLSNIVLYGTTAFSGRVISGGPITVNRTEVSSTFTANEHNEMVIVFPADVNTIIGVDKYNINLLSKKAKGVSILSSEFDYIPLTSMSDCANLGGSFDEFISTHPNLTSFYQDIGSLVSTYTISGNISCLENNTTIQQLRIIADGIVGNLASLLNCTALTYVEVRNTRIVSTQATVDALRARGVTVIIPEENIIPE